MLAEALGRRKMTQPRRKVVVSGILQVRAEFAPAGLVHNCAPSCRECLAEVHRVLSSSVVELVLVQAERRF